MKIFVLSLAFLSEVNAVCRNLKAASRQDCQKICDLVANCETWTFEKDLKDCLIKHRDGWTRKASPFRDSGVKNQGPWYEPDVDYYGGDIECPE